MARQKFVHHLGRLESQDKPPTGRINPTVSFKLEISEVNSEFSSFSKGSLTIVLVLIKSKCISTFSLLNGLIRKYEVIKCYYSAKDNYFGY